MDTRVEASEASAPEDRLAFANAPLIRFALVGLFIIAFVYALYFARDFFMPVVLAFLLALTLSPVVRFFLKRGIPAAISATLLVIFSAGAIGITGYLVSGPVADLVDNAPSLGQQVTERLTELRKPFDHLLRITIQVDHIAEVTEEPGVQKVVVAQPGIISRAAGTLMSVGTSIAVTFVLSLFLLAS